ncbi:GNAT family N-acetyltransferase [Photobacterium minamisatsumaniensis]|uniref:GNAT family N-acetyltransferase n=1 Tax=Photobacterium minamisatsumaniensis TaxID=2910233 RepID=UPI003D0E032D
MKILETEFEDLSSVVELVARVSQSDILPHFSEEGRVTFSSKVLPDVEMAFDKTRFQSLKVIEKDKLVGFGAIRDKEYITHLFIDKNSQGFGVGKLLIDQLLKFATSNEVCLKASVNSVGFYESQGFKSTSEESEVSGIRFVPMCWVRT